MPKLVCLDTQILIWGIQETASPGQEDMIDRAKQLLNELHKEKAQVIIPSIVISEFLVKIPDDTQQMLIKLFERGFQIMPYDTVAALQFTKIWNTNVDSIVKSAVLDGSRPSRHELKADICILAVATARNAESIYSADRRHLSRFARGFIAVHDLRLISPFGPLFDTPSTEALDATPSDSDHSP